MGVERNDVDRGLSRPALAPLSAIAYDSARGVMVMSNGYGGSGALSDTWFYSGSLSARATNLVDFSFVATGDTVATTAIQQLSVAATAGGTGYTSPSHSFAGAPVPGAVVGIWDVSTGGGWRAEAANTASAASPAAASFSISSNWELLHDIYGPDGNIHLAAFPLQSNGNGAAAGSITLGDPEVTVRYQHSKSSCTVTDGSTCACAADETACGSVCSNLPADPQNCGACGNVCAGGTECINGACACPGTETVCGGVCTDTSVDSANCGTCSNACGAYRSCNSGVCSTCQAGQSLVSGVCVNDTAVRYSTSQSGGSGTLTLAVPPSVQVGDLMIVVATPQDKGAFAAAVTSGSGQSWAIAGVGNDATQSMAVFTKTAAAGDINQNVTVTMNTSFMPVVGETSSHR